ncbi:MULTISPECIES: PP2C family protein-serine/threonine phosphatase [unclassified Streptomyces]|uniref:PP2C family protein-serine/threonine phosphatase n=1 Tax=unclassified Streptomyces TaxID=2593676 RepID=UPI00365D7759
MAGGPRPVPAKAKTVASPELPAAVFDPDRLRAVVESQLMDTEPEGAFDDLARLAMAITGTDMAFFTVADGRRSFWKSAVGIDPAAGRENDIRDSPCHLLIATGRPLIAEDAVTDARIKDLAAIGALGIGAWAGYPVVSPDGHVLGGFCVIDDQARQFTDAQRESLKTLARSVSSEIALRQALRAALASGAASAELARTLQESLLPPSLPQVPGLDVAALHLPADATHAEVLGDFYDLFRTPGKTWCAVLGDVCGKGIEAAKVTALARYTVRTEATQHPRPATVLRRLHHALFDQKISDRFLTAALTTFKVRDDGSVSGRYTSAGHPPALIRRADGTVEELHIPGTMLTTFLNPDQVRLGETTFTLRAGDALLLYSDGITEARTRQRGPFFGEDALAAALAATVTMDAHTTLSYLRKAVTDHTGGYAVDDTALLLLRVPTHT